MIILSLSQLTHNQHVTIIMICSNIKTIPNSRNLHIINIIHLLHSAIFDTFIYTCSRVLF